MHIYENIRDKLKKNKYIIYLVKNNNFKLILKHSGTKKELIDILVNKYKKEFHNNHFICYKFSFHTGTKPLQGGPLSVSISSLKNEIVNNKNIHGKVWFQRKYLEKFGWSDLYLDNMTKKLITGKVDLLPLVVNMYNVYF